MEDKHWLEKMLPNNVTIVDGWFVIDGDSKNRRRLNPENPEQVIMQKGGVTKTMALALFSLNWQFYMKSLADQYGELADGYAD